MNKKYIWGLIGILIITVVAAAVVFIEPEIFTPDPLVEEDPEAAAIEQARDTAQDWIVNYSPTYTFDGSDLTLVSEEELAANQGYLFIFSFTSSSAGYGDRTDEMTAQVITPHVMEVVVENNQVVTAVTDEVYDELNNDMIDDETMDEETEEAPEILTIDLYFMQVVAGQEEEIAVEREIPYTVATAKAAIEELLEGPTAEEKEAGLMTLIPEGTQLQNIEIVDGTAQVDFNQQLDEGVAGSAMVAGIRNQIEQTLLQFETVDEVVISVEGETEEILQP